MQEPFLCVSQKFVVGVGNLAIPNQRAELFQLTVAHVENGNTNVLDEAVRKALDGKGKEVIKTIPRKGCVGKLRVSSTCRSYSQFVCNSQHDQIGCCRRQENRWHERQKRVPKGHRVIFDSESAVGGRYIEPKKQGACKKMLGRGGVCVLPCWINESGTKQVWLDCESARCWWIQFFL